MATAPLTHPAPAARGQDAQRSSAAELQLRWRDGEGEFHVTSLAASRRLAVERFEAVHQVSAYVNQGHYSGRFALSSSGRHVVFRSKLGRDCLYVLDFERAVEDVVGLPFYVRRADSEGVGVVPDFLVKLAGGRRRVVSVAWAGRDGGQKARDAHRELDMACAYLDWEHVVMGPPHETLLVNLTLLHGARRAPAWLDEYAPALMGACRTWTSLGEVCDAHGAQALARGGLLHLLWTHRVRVHDLSVPLSDATLVRAR